MEKNNSELQAFLVEHPRMMGVLFTLMLLLSQVGMVAAQNSSTTIGP